MNVNKEDPLILSQPCLKAGGVFLLSQQGFSERPKRRSTNSQRRGNDFIHNHLKWLQVSELVRGLAVKVSYIKHTEAKRGWRRGLPQHWEATVEKRLWYHCSLY